MAYEVEFVNPLHALLTVSYAQIVMPKEMDAQRPEPGGWNSD
ncbi:hypothetical protein [Azospirillum sp.]|nr:hypothetical protein [Azospirillum sp.]